MSDLKLFLFGSPRLERDGAPLPLKRRKAVALLTYLAMTGEVHNREALAALFWPDYDASRGRAYLRRDLAEINTLLGEGWLMADREQIGLDRSANLWVDVARFQQLLATCQAHDHPVNEVCPDCLSLLAEAVELYHGDFLAGFTLPDAADFDEWQFFQTESLRQALAEALEKLVGGYCVQGEFKQAVPYARRWASLDPLHGPAQQQLMQVYAWAGQQAAALRQYDEYARILDEEIGVSPDEEIIALYEAVKAKQLPPLPQAGEQGSKGAEEEERHDTEVSLASLHSCTPVPPHNLSAQSTPFIGREAELTDVQQLILNGSECRLLTLIGPGGIGKTRLAIQAAWQVATEAIEAFPYGIYFIPLAPVGAAEFLVQTIAEALHFSFYTGSSPKTQLLNYLCEKEVLLILDDFEHLLNDVGAVNLLSEILANAPKGKLLVTSRERLNLQEEWVIEIGGLPFPEIDTAEFLETQRVQSPVIESYDALQLFVQSARRASVGFSLSAENVSYVVRICQLVGGMPLGIELASAWVRMLPCREIAQEIERNLDFLTTPVRNIPERHQSLRAVFEHSWKLLTPVERHLFRKLSVFRGGFRREAAEVVADASLILLSALIDKSLLRRNTAGRYEMHHLLGQYAAEKLEEVINEKVQVQAQHARYYATFLQ
jgi:predicted ATPase/DNA-binding SARP family transcriptional activator